MRPLMLLRLEGAAVLAASVEAYQWSHASWLLFTLLFLAPDLSMIGYAVNARVGSIAFNAIHTYTGPLALGAYAWTADYRTLFAIGLIWMAHIGFDRLVGSGLKYPTRFSDTHLNPVRHGIETRDRAGELIA